jgi:hypothetical protein
MFTKRAWVQLSLVLAALVIFGPRSLAQTRFLFFGRWPSALLSGEHARACSVSATA